MATQDPMQPSILVVEDEPNIVDSLSFLMKQEGYRVRIARDGDAALRTIDAQIPDLVILDLMLPRRDGYDVCRVIRQDERCQAVKIMMLTARGRELDRRKGLELGADEYVTKPFSNRDIVARSVVCWMEGRPKLGSLEKPAMALRPRRRSYIKSAGQHRERTFALFVLALLAVNPPLLSIFSKSTTFLGLPLLYLYLFAVWSLIILFVALNVAARQRERDHGEEARGEEAKDAKDTGGSLPKRRTDSGAVS